MTLSWWKWHHFNKISIKIRKILKKNYKSWIFYLSFYPGMAFKYVFSFRNTLFDRKRKFRNEILSQNSEKISSFLLYCLIYSRKFPKIQMKTKWPAAILLLFSNQTFFKCQNIQRYCIQHHAWVVLPVENRKKLIISL